jgi:hypothetical protein
MSLAGLTNRLLLLVLLLGLLGGFNIDEYYPSLNFREGMIVLVAVTLLLLLIGARLSLPEWWSIILLPITIIVLPSLIYALIFALRHDVPLLPSVLAMRFLVYYLLGPTMLLMFRRGISIEAMERVLLIAIVIAAIIYLIAYSTIDFETFANASGRSNSNLVRVDGWRGYRLDGPVFAFLLAIVYFGKKTFSAQRGSLKVPLIALLAAMTYIFSTMLSRAHLASIVIASVAYPLCFAGVRRRRVFYFLSPLIVTLVVLLILFEQDEIYDLLRSDTSFKIRMSSAAIAWSAILKYPIFGIGVASNNSLSYQQLFGYSFYPSDLGALGIWFRFGLVGLIGYYLFGVWLLVRLNHFGQVSGRLKTDPVFWSITISIIAMLVAVSIDAFLYGESIPIAGFALGLILILGQIEAAKQRRNVASKAAGVLRRRLSTSIHGRGVPGRPK